MASQPRVAFPTPDDYLAQERESAQKHEYLAGEIVAMSGASRAHNLIVSNIVISVGAQLRGRDCEIYSSDMRVRAPLRRGYFYPDVVALCGEPELEDTALDTLLNPTMIVEVLSPSTERFDRGRKFALYRTMPSLREYLLVSQGEPRVEHYLRQEDGSWRLVEHQAMEERVALFSIGCALPLHEIYDKVQFSELTEESEHEHDGGTDS